MNKVSEKVRAYPMPPYVKKQEQGALAPWIIYPKDSRHQARARGKAAKTPGTPENRQNELDQLMNLFRLLQGIPKF